MSKRTNHSLPTVCVLAVLLSSVTAIADNFELDWWTIDGGGEMWTTGGNFELSGTIGQPDAGVIMTGGNFELAGGFWPGAFPGITPGDLNCDGVIDFDDIDPFVLALSDPTEYQSQYPNCNILSADCDLDGDIDFDDIDPFVEILSGGS